MTRTLILTRHAKSSWGDPSLDDFDRTLNARGRKSAVVIGTWLRGNGYVPDEVIVSAARRTVETWERMAPEMPADTVMRGEPGLYHASAETMLKVLRTARAATVMMIGHNPGIADFAARIVLSPAAHDRFSDYPTAATTVIEFPSESWEAVDWGTGRIKDFVIPRELI